MNQGIGPSIAGMLGKVEADLATRNGDKDRKVRLKPVFPLFSEPRFCSAHDEVRDYFLHRTRMNKVVPLGVQREQFRSRLDELRTMLTAA